MTFTDLTWLRGGPQAQIELRFGGGELDGLREEVAGVPQFTVGERRVIFAHAGHFVSPIVGFNQGLFRVVDGADGPVVLDADGQGGHRRRPRRRCSAGRPAIAARRCRSTRSSPACARR